MEATAAAPSAARNVKNIGNPLPDRKLHRADGLQGQNRGDVVTQARDRGGLRRPCGSTPRTETRRAKPMRSGHALGGRLGDTATSAAPQQPVYPQQPFTQASEPEGDG